MYLSSLKLLLALVNMKNIVGYIQLRSKLKLFTKKSSSRVVLLVDAFRSSDYFFPEINR